MQKRPKSIRLFFLLGLLVFATGMQWLSVDAFHDPPYKIEVPKGFPPIPIPEDNALTESRVELGKRLFSDPILSRDYSISCASCHLENFAFSDTVSLSQGVEGRVAPRNSPSLVNVAYHPRVMRDGGVPTLEMQILVPIQEHNEFDFNILLIAERMNAEEDYVALSQKAYGRAPDSYVITRSIAAFERTLIGGTSRYDQFIQGDAKAFTADEKQGYELFRSDRLNCTQCHSGFLLTDFSYQNNGLYIHYADSGRARITKLPEDRAKFKVPSLRNVALTAPYMHNGSIQTLEDVIRHYEHGGKDHPSKNEAVRGFSLTTEERFALVAFLEALTDQ